MNTRRSLFFGSYILTRRGILHQTRRYQHRLPDLSQIPRPVMSRKPKSEATQVKHIVDWRRIQVKAGNGGDGCISFLRLCSNPNAGPDGGDGGNGGHVIFKATSNKRSLDHLTTLVNAPDGEKGSHRDCCGRNAQHLVTDVPIGTMFKSVDGTVLADLCEDGAMFVAARGGAGGRGNHFFATGTNQSPEIAEVGANGEEQTYLIELRTIAHVGLVGFPNAGKSTLLRAISRARPKVAPYPFTTLNPHVGIVEYEDQEQVAVADIPGLIPDAHKNRGLGIGFLRHIERCVCLLYVLDASVMNPWEQVETLQFELSQYSKELVGRASAIVANKMDLPEAQENLPDLQKFASQLNLPLFPVSAHERQNLLPLLLYIRHLYDLSNKE